MVMLSLLVSIYYNMIVAWSLIYIFMIVTGQSYKWSSCLNDFNTIFCSSSLEDSRCQEEIFSSFLNSNFSVPSNNASISAFYFNGSCYSSMDLDAKQAKEELFARLGAVSPAEEFFE